MAIPTRDLIGAAEEPEVLAPAAPEPQALVPAFVSMVERLAVDPRVDVDKLERLLALQERVIAQQARAEFESAFAEMQGELPAIDERGRIEVNGVVRSKYARYEDIQAAVRPVLKQHGFSLRHREEDLPDGKLRIVGILSHRAGHREEDKFDCPPDASGGKSNIQAIGSTRSYGMRYTTISLLNIETRGMDDDGHAAGRKAPAAAPEGFEDWLTDMAACADEGTATLQAAWAKSSKEYRAHLTTTQPKQWAALKAKAGKAVAS